MTKPHDIDRLLGQWFSDGPTEVPDRVIDVVADRIERQSQRPAWRLQWKDIHVNTYLKPLAAVAAVVVVAVVGYNLLPGASTGVGGPAATPSPSATTRPGPTSSPSPSVAPSPSDVPNPTNAAVGRLAPGAHTSRAFTYPITYTVPAGWYNGEDYPADLALSIEAIPGIGVITIWGAVYVASQDAACTESPDPGRGHKAADFIDLLTTHPGIVASRPAAVTIGGLKGSLVDIALAPSWKTACPYSEGQPFVPYATDSMPGPPGFHWGIQGAGRARVIFLDAKDGETIFIVIDSVDGTTFDTIVAQSMPVVESFVFKP